MLPPTTAELVSVWESGLRQPRLDTALHLLCLTDPALTPATAAALSIGERDARLLQLRIDLFGSRLANKADCPVCAETVEWETDARDLLLQTPVPNAPVRQLQLDQDDFSIRFRLPDSYDLHRAMTHPTYANHPQQLLLDCILRLEHQGAETPVETLPMHVADALTERMAEADPQADLQMVIGCPGCGHSWSVWFDIVRYLWVEIDNWAKHLMQEVVLLARSFGWSEGEILALTPQRRQLYIDLIRG